MINKEVIQNIEKGVIILSQVGINGLPTIEKLLQKIKEEKK